MVLKITFCHHVWIFMHSRAGIPCTVNNIMGKPSLIHEENATKIVQVCLWQFTTLYMRCMIFQYKMSYSLHGMQIKTISVQISPYLCRCNISYHGYSVYTRVRTSLQCIQKTIFSMPLLLTFGIPSWERTSLPHTSGNVE